MKNILSFTLVFVYSVYVIGLMLNLDTCFVDMGVKNIPDILGFTLATIGVFREYILLIKTKEGLR